MRALAAASLIVILAACTTSSGSVGEKVLSDFGLREQPEGYVAPSDRVFENLDDVGVAEMARLNRQGRHGEIKYEEGVGIGGSYYKESKVYDGFRPVDAQRMPRTTQGQRGYTGQIAYDYSIYQSERRPTRAEAQALTANIPTGDSGNETYRYRFGANAQWNGQAGELIRR